MSRASLGYCCPDLRSRRWYVMTHLLAQCAAVSAVGILLTTAVNAAGENPIATVEEAPLRAHLAFLSSDLLEGRGTGQRGGDLARLYVDLLMLGAPLADVPFGATPATGRN
jgi:hypothetical protein